MRLIIAAKPRRRDLRQHQRAGPVAIEDPALRHQRHDHIGHMPGVGAVAGADGDQAVVDAVIGAARHRLAVQPGPLPPDRGIEVARQRMHRHPGHHLPVLDQRDHHAPMRQPRQIGRGAVDRVDHPLKAGGARGLALLLSQDGVMGIGGGDGGADQILDLAVGAADDVLGGGLGLDHQLIAVVEIAQRQRAAAGGGVAGQVEAGAKGVGHGASLRRRGSRPWGRCADGRGCPPAAGFR